MARSHGRLVLALTVLALALALGAVLWISAGGRGGGGAPGAVRGVERGAEAEPAPLAAARTAGEAARSAVEVPSAPAEDEAATAPRGDDRPRAFLSVRVVDGGHRPVTGARVELRRGIEREFAVLDRDLHRLAETVAAGVSGADGGFRWELPRGVPVDVAVSAAGFADAIVPDRYAGEDVEVVLTAGFLVHGRITRAADGAPVEGARVRVFHSGGPAALSVQTRSDDDGRYELRPSFHDAAMLEVVPRVLRMPEWTPLAFGPDGTCEQDVALEEGVVALGRVTDAETGAPIEGATVGEGWWYARTATTDARGEYRMPGFGAPKIGELFAKAPGYGEARCAQLPAAKGGEVHVDFVLAPGRSAIGRVLDPSGAPLAGARVSAVASEEGSAGQETDWITVTTGADGRFRIIGLTAHLSHWLLVAEHGCATHVFDFPPSELEQRETDLGDLTLTRPTLVAGHVLDEKDAGVADVEVTLDGSNADRWSLSGSRRTSVDEFYVTERSLHTDGRGRFAFGDVAAGSYVLRAKKEGAPPLEPLAVLVEDGVHQDDLVLRMRAGLAIRGRVVDEEGRPLASVLVQSNPLPWPGQPGRREPAKARTGADGSFALAGLPPGSYELTAWPSSVAQNDPDAPWLITSVEHVPAGTEDVEIVIERGAAIRGVLLDAQGHALPDHIVTASDGVRAVWDSARTDLEGRFVLAVTRGSTCEVVARGEWGSGFSTVLETRDGVPAGTTDLVIRLGR